MKKLFSLSLTLVLNTGLSFADQNEKEGQSDLSSGKVGPFNQGVVPEALVDATQLDLNGEKTVLDISLIYQEVTGKRVIVSSRLAAKKVLLQTQRPLKNDQIATELEKALLKSGVRVLSKADSPDLVRLVEVKTQTAQ